MIVRKALHQRGFRFRIHRKSLPGNPDITLPKYKSVVRVMGCFWHGHYCPRGARVPFTNRFYWTDKIRRNKTRDILQGKALENIGWKVFDIWECELKSDKWLDRLVRNIKKSRVH